MQLVGESERAQDLQSFDQAVRLFGGLLGLTDLLFGRADDLTSDPDLVEQMPWYRAIRTRAAGQRGRPVRQPRQTG
jgi:hypothetical protein